MLKGRGIDDKQRHEFLKCDPRSSSISSSSSGGGGGGSSSSSIIIITITITCRQFQPTEYRVIEPGVFSQVPCSRVVATHLTSCRHTPHILPNFV